MSVPCCVCMDPVEPGIAAKCYVCGTHPLCRRCIGVDDHDCEEG